MKRIHHMAAVVLVALAGFAAIGAGFLLVATATVIGALVTFAARLAVSGRTCNDRDWAATEREEGQVGT